MHRLLAALAAALLFCGPAWADADTILLNGKIITVDDRFSIVQAVAVKDARIFAAGK